MSVSRTNNPPEADDNSQNLVPSTLPSSETAPVIRSKWSFREFEPIWYKLTVLQQVVLDRMTFYERVHDMNDLQEWFKYLPDIDVEAIVKQLLELQKLYPHKAQLIYVDEDSDEDSPSMFMYEHLSRIIDKLSCEWWKEVEAVGKFVEDDMDDDFDESDEQENYCRRIKPEHLRRIEYENTRRMAEIAIIKAWKAAELENIYARRVAQEDKSVQ
jgi:hypothetical protein